ncbi:MULTISPECIES: alpha/beta fold hydrolase [Streptomyces]|uniref:Peptidase S33 family protein n=1 Tax=Streptomyces tsukubensis (strain DSM 42081 / NBRC 108919 / NRRL 18488 / 9993) TaxID=1114943 RepID=I2N2L2_STRT9|nr:MULTISPECIES: alpha/beta fold hydrolase [Streptomyces]AZK98499.1 peptidase S33 family protein [Streptomyces tsukubensis]EIF91259.1 TAP domain-containing protein [Streptomyces tsukubensis NRRL18488]MYS64681.1 alpha/beta fold hydrolase [Streptomyces sp. SID5473]QKM68573.1 peptidase S33 family protein [Streptomyces tsukubensis NRRL18488]TAI43381.1 alpha/beta fold hydrolase [Streptomyces tsukubensis]
MNPSTPITRTNPRPVPAPGAEPGAEPASGGSPAAGRRALSVLLAVAASAALAAPVATAAPAGKSAPKPPGGASTPIVWGPCKGDPPMPDPGPQAECGTVQVPVDWSKPNGPRTGIAVARQKATDPAKRIGVLMVNPGGPGNSGVESAMYADNPIDGYSTRLRQRFDIVGFDPRGIGRSGSAVCDDAAFAKIPSRPRSAAEWEKVRTLNAQAIQSCRQGTGPLAAEMDSNSVVRDMDAIRAALGERKISYLGHSYGTFLGERYSRLFPKNLRTMVLDSAMDPAPSGAEQYLTDTAVTASKSLEKLSSSCAADPSCTAPGLPKGKKLTAVIDELFARADAGTLRKPGPNGPTRAKVTPDELTGLLNGLAGGGYPDQATEQLGALYSGKGEVRFHGDGPVNAAIPLVLCRDSDYRIRDWAEYRAIRERVAAAAPYVRYNDQALSFTLSCQGSPLPVEPRPAQAAGTLPPVLVVNAVYDLPTPLAGARRMAAAIPTATLHEVDTVGHVLYLMPAVKPVIDNHLIHRTR